MNPFSIKEIAEAFSSKEQKSEIPNFEEQAKDKPYKPTETTDFDDLSSDIPNFTENDQQPDINLKSKDIDANLINDTLNESTLNGSLESLKNTENNKLSHIDDNGNIYKDENGELLPNTEYEINGIKYKTDENGRPMSWEGNLKDSPETRNNRAQSEAGGKDRLPGDQGGHLVANMNGGSSGNENLVAMRDKINQGDYKKGELEENNMLKNGKEVYESGKLNYSDDSKRPATIEKTYTDGEKTVKAKYDNRESSEELLKDAKESISTEDYDNLNNEISDMKDDGNKVSITSVVKEYDSNGNLSSTQVGVLNETTGEKTYKYYKNYEGEENGKNS